MNKTLKYAVFLSRWAQGNGFTIDKTAEIVHVARKCGTLNTHAVNGDPHPRETDRSACSAAWEKDLDRWTAKLAELVKGQGFKVEYNGIYPSLVRKATTGNGEVTVFIPMDL